MFVCCMFLELGWSCLELEVEVDLNLVEAVLNLNWF